MKRICSHALMPTKMQRGLTLIEIMISLAVSLVLLTGVVQMYAGTKHSYRVTEELSRIQENGRFALDVIARDIRMADFWGCLGGLADSNLTNNLNPAGTGYDVALDGFEHSVSGTDGTGGSSNPEPDTLILGGAYGRGVNIQPPYGPQSNANVKVDDTSGLDAGDIVIISDCGGGDIFQIQGTPQGSVAVHNSNQGTVNPPGNYNPAGQTCTSGHCLSKVYQGNAQLYEVRALRFSVKVNNDGEPGLYRGDRTQDLELVRNVENMQFLYGVDTDNDKVPNQYKVADKMLGTDWDKVIAIRVGLLLRSSQPVHPNNQNKTLKVADASIPDNDRFLRKVFTTTVVIRNRLR